MDHANCPLKAASEYSDRARWKGATLEERAMYFKAEFVAHGMAARVINALNQRKTILLATGDGRGLMILGPPNVGKTTLIQYLSAVYPQRVVRELLDPADEHSIVERTELDFVAVNIPNPCTFLSVCNAILKALGHPDCEGKDAATQKKLMMASLTLARVVFLAVDNVQDIPELRGPKGTSNIGNLFREIVDECHVIVLLFGTAAAQIVVNANDQLHRRGPGLLHLGPYDITTAAGLGAALLLIDQLDDALPLAEKSDLATLGKGSVGRGLACAGDGKTGTIKEILVAALVHTLAAGRERMTKEDLKQGYDDLYLEYAEEVDPWADGFKPRRLSLPGEPHFTMTDVRHSKPAKGRT